MPKSKAVIIGSFFVVTLLALGVVAAMGKLEHQPGTLAPFRVSAPLAYGPEGADPAHIQFNDTWGFLENLASPLIQWSVDGQLSSGLAESFEWQGDELHLKIRSDFKTVDGLTVTAEDAAFSLKRVIILARNTHGFIADFLCGDHKLTKLTDDCPGIKTSDDVLILKPLRGKAFLVKMLTAMDFVVLLRSEVDPDTLAIKSFRNTTGPYYLDGDPKVGTQRYVANKGHWLWSAAMPQEVEIVRYDSAVQKPKDSSFGLMFEMFVEKKTDVLTNFASDRAEMFPVAAHKAADSASIAKTLDIGRAIAVFTPRGVRELSAERRIAIGKAMQNVFRKTFVDGSGISTPEDQFFATFGEGRLDEEQLSKLKSNFGEVTTDKDGAGVRISLPESMTKAQQELKLRLPKASVGMDMVSYVEGTLKGQQPHVYVIQTDTGWTEDLGLLSYSISMKQFFPGNQEEGQAWLKRYVDIEDKAERLKLLRELHLRILSEPWVVPLIGQPYFAVVRKPWVYKGPTLFNSGALWRFQHP